MAEYCVGIDLGTTNSAVAYATADGHVKHGIKLPSCLFFDEDNQEVLGEQARQLGAKTPTRFVHSAKSWLSNPAAARKEAILPEGSGQGRLSPVEASARYLAEMSASWKHGYLADQEVILTIPASFDEVARKLTLEAAAMAGLPHVTLLEEPQAAFYNWLQDHQTELPEGAIILVCDIGGGTTDFSLIEVTSSGFMRMAVGNHLLLGGDNMDHALAHAMKGKVAADLDTHQWLTLLHEARSAKEQLLHTSGEHTVYLSTGGAQIVGGGVTTSLTSEEVEAHLVDGFFPLLPFEAAQQLTRGSGIRTMGLPFEPEPAITKHLAAFLAAAERQPTHLLFNGGGVKPKQFQKRIHASLALWFGKEVEELKTDSLDLAVSRGAVYFARARQGIGTRIKSGSPRAYYLKLNDAALTLLPRGADEGTSYTSDKQFTLRTNQPVSFELLHSHTRLNDAPNSLIPIDDQMLPLPPIHTILKYGKQTDVPASLKVSLTEIGTIELHLTSGTHTYLLEFATDHHHARVDETFDTTYLDAAKNVLQQTFAVGSSEALKSLMPKLEEALDRPKNTWPLSILRALFDTLILQAHKRNLATHYETRFWNLAGFFLRPGIGYPLDAHRIREVWKLLLADAHKPTQDEVEIQKWICYRRMAAGLSKGQQSQLFNALYPSLFKQRGETYAYTEKLRALASFELVDTTHKTKLGNALLNRIEENTSLPVDFWAVGRLGARQLLHGTIANITPKKVAEDWIKRLLKTPWFDKQHTPFTLALLTRKTDSPPLNITPTLVSQVKECLNIDLAALLDEERTLSPAEQARMFGESLPSGVVLQKPI